MADPSVLAARLRELRSAAKLSQTAAAGAAGIPQSTVAFIERGRRLPTPEQVAALAAAYQVPDDQAADLVASAHDVRRERQRIVVQRGIAPSQQQITEDYRASRRITTYSPVGVAGWLTSPAYARRLFTGPDGSVNEDYADGLASRLDQIALTHDPARHWVALVPEGALGWALLDHGEMAKLVDYIAEASTRPNIDVRVIPFGVHTQLLPLESWTICDTRLVSCGLTAGAMRLERPEDIALYTALAAQLAELALTGDQARERLTAVAAQYRAIS